MRRDEQWCRERFAAARVARLATIAADGPPRLVPVVVALIGEASRNGEALCTAVDGKPKSTSALARLADIRADPRVTFLVDGWDEDWDRLWWARAQAVAQVLDIDDPGAAVGIAALRDRYPQYATVPLTGPVIIARVVRWTGWSAAVSGSGTA